MSYQVLAVKWRPKRFDELVGQAHVVTALVNSLAAGRLHHAYLFSGTRGVGKTTIARILAKALNCETGVTAEPCGECAACVAIDEGRFVDLIEVDAASRTRVDDTRELLDNVQYMPTRGRFKVYLVDEVHMLSNHSFNALLKTLEEPPPHVKFLFATTDPQKLPVTVLSRCLQFNLKRLPLASISEQLDKICRAEGVEAEPEGLRAIARAADGSMRDALSLLDQGIAFGGGGIAEAEIKSMLGSIDRGHVLRFVEAIARDDGAGVLAEVDRLDELAPDYPAVLDELMAVLQRIAVAQLVESRSLDEDEDAIRALAATLTPEDVQLYFQIAVNGRRDIAVCRDERMSFEMTLLRMLAFKLEESEPAEAASGPGGRSAPRSVVRAKQAPRPAGAGAAAAAPDSAGPPPGPNGTRPAPGAASSARDDGLRAPGPASSSVQDLPPFAPPLEAEDSSGGAEHVGAGPDPVPTGSPAVGDADWQSLIAAAALTGAARNLANHCEIARREPGRIELVLAEGKAQFNTERVRGRLEAALSDYLGQRLRLKITVGKPPRATPAEVRQANEDERMRKAREAIERDPTIRAVQSAFDAVLEPDTIQPAEPNRHDSRGSV